MLFNFSKQLIALVSKRGAISLLTLFLLAICAHGDVIPAARRIIWDPGVRGGIPTRTISQTLNVGATTAQINAAIANCPAGQVVKLGPGIFTISDRLIVKSGVTLRGSGMGVTIISGGGGNVHMVYIGSPGADTSWTASTPRNLTATGLTKGSNTINTAVAHGWSVGDYVMIDQLSDSNGDPPRTSSGDGTCTWCGRCPNNCSDATQIRPINQWVQITAVPTSTSATIDPPLYLNYNMSKTPQGYKVVGATTYAGIEDLTIDNSLSSKRDILQMDYAINCWLLRVELKGVWRRALWMYGGLWNTVRGCKIHDGTPAAPYNGGGYVTDRAYGIFLGPGPTACLIEDNIFHSLTVGVAFEGGVSGHVFAYNYITNILWWDPNPGRPHVLGHGGHSEQILVEGNWMDGRFGVDSYWGTGAYFTVFRNRINQQSPRIEQTWTVDIERKNRYQNIVGNILGTIGREDLYELSGASSSYSGGPKVIYRLGYGPLDTNFASGDAQVKATLYRHGNWDSVNRTQLWESSNTDHTLPNSLYLSSKPSWFGTLGWPPFDPANPSVASADDIPAGNRYLGGPIPTPAATPTPTPGGTPTATPTPTPGVTPVATPTPIPLGTSFPSTAGEITNPFVINTNTISQLVQTVDPTQGGRALYNFSVPAAGDYLLSIMVNCQDGGSNSVFVNIDAEPSPVMYWDIPVTSGPQIRIASWAPSTTPKAWTLNAGTHQLIIRGREANTILGQITLGIAPRAPEGLHVP